MELGVYHNLKVLRETSVGLFLGNEKGEEVLIPRKFVLPEYKIDDTIKVFLYLDSDERPTATSQIPDIELNGFAFLEVGFITPIGAFMNWNIDKQLLVPFQEQKTKMKEGEFHLVHMYLDEKSNRLVASAKWQKFLSKDTEGLKEGDEVDIMVLGESPLGYNCIVNQKFQGLAYSNENFKEVETGQLMKAYIKQVRNDGKLDLLFEKPGVETLEKHAEKILKILRTNGGRLPFHDKSDAKEVQDSLQMSKKAFKRAIGNLYKQKLIALTDDGIKLTESDKE